MRLKKLLEEKRSVIVRHWLARTLESYPAETARFLKEEKDGFLNPVGHALAARLPALFDALASGAGAKSIEVPLETLVRIRAVQDLTPAQAVGFLLELKRVLREQFADELRDSGLFEDLFLFERRIDEALLLAFELFMRCRETAYEIRMREAQRQVFVLQRLSTPARGPRAPFAGPGGTP